MEIRRYTLSDTEKLMGMIRAEGEAWQDYWGDTGIERYKALLADCFVLVCYEGETLCGYVRCRDDRGFGVYIYDLLVRPLHRGKAYGRALIDQICAHFAGETVYVMSDVDAYYEKQGFQRVGSLYEAKAGH